MKQHVVEIGTHDAVRISKLFGPTVFFDLRIRPNIETGEWVIERYFCFPAHDEDTWAWVEWVRIPGQFGWECVDDSAYKTKEVER